MSRQNKQQKDKRRRDRTFREKRADRAWEKPEVTPRGRRRHRHVAPSVINFGNYAVALQSSVSRDGISDEAIAELGGPDAIESLRQKVFAAPKAAIPLLEQALERCPGTPTLMNWLAKVHLDLGANAKGQELIRLNYELNPNYLFAKMNLLQIFLSDQKFDEATQLLDGKFDLHEMYPDRSIFSVSEFMGYAAAMLQYYLAMDLLDEGAELYDKLSLIDLDDAGLESLHQMLAQGVRLREAKLKREGEARRQLARSLTARAT